MNWTRVIKSLEQSAADRQNRANVAALTNKHDQSARMEETAHVLRELAYALKLGIE